METHIIKKKYVRKFIPSRFHTIRAICVYVFIIIRTTTTFKKIIILNKYNDVQ